MIFLRFSLFAIGILLFAQAAHGDTLVGFSQFNEITLLDPSSGSASLIATLDLDYFPAQKPYAVDAINNKAYVIGGKHNTPERLYTTDLITGSVTSIPLSSFMYGIDYYSTSAPPIVPEPTSSILFVTGGTLLAGRRYLKRKHKTYKKD